jgi:peptidoglycan/LPS O-acetylase OafA/YrhL
VTAGRLPFLDGLRGIAALLVVFQHVQPDERLPTGILGVDVFFALSGFLIGGILLDSRGRPDFWRSFFVRRTFRIWPLYETVVVLLACTGNWTPVGSREPTWMLALFLGNFALVGVTAARKAAGVLWSIAVEEHFYVLLPPIVASLPARRLPIVLLGLIASASCCRWYVAQHAGFMAAYVLTPCRLDALCWGVLAAWILRFRPGSVGLIAAAAPLLVLLRVAVLPINFAAETTAGAVLFWQPLAVIATAALILRMVSRPRDMVARMLSLRWLGWVGTVSYGVYLLHPLIIESLNAALPTWRGTPGEVNGGLLVGMRFVVVAGLSVGVASISWLFFEKPLLQWSDRFRHRAVPPTTEVSVS